MKYRFLLTCLSVCLVSVSIGNAHEGHGDKGHGDKDHGHDHGDRMMTDRQSSQVLPMTDEKDVFHFVIYGDRTGGVPEGLKVLSQAVQDTNLLDPDLVMTVGDLIQGYNETPEWLPQMERYKAIMGDLGMPWYPVAGNHDVYWRGKGPAPDGHHEANYEKHFGPLWYSFSHKNAGFIVLYSDEGDSATNTKNFSQGKLQTMSDRQLAFLNKALQQHESADHVFVFLHHPRWIMPNYEGGNWEVVHQALKSAGNVSAVFAGHIHHIHYGGQRDGIEYHTLATTGGHLSADIPGAGYLHHMNMVSVRQESISVSSIPVGAVLDPKEFTPEFLADVGAARSIRPRTDTPGIQLQVDGRADGELTYELSNPSKRTVSATMAVEAKSRWMVTPDHFHADIEPGSSQTFSIRFSRNDGDSESFQIPRLSTTLDYVGESSRIRLPVASTPVPVKLASVPANYFAGSERKCLSITGPSSAVRVESSDLKLPDSPFTVEAWLRPKNTDGYVGAVAKTESSEFAIFIDEGVPQFDVNLGGSYVTAAARDVMTPGKWTHVAGVFDGQNVKIYVDGALAGSKAGSGKRKTNKLPLYLGADVDRRGSPTRPFIGDVDEVRISSAAVYEDHFTPKRRLEPGEQTVLLMHCDRAVGPFLLDHSDQAAKATMGISSVLIDSE